MSQPPPPSPLLPAAEAHRHPFSFKATSHSLWIIVLILTITVAVSILLCLLLRHLNRRCIRRLAPSSAASGAVESRRVSARRVNPETSAVALPLFTYSAITRRSSTTVAADCAVCLSKFEPADELRLLPLCCHAFHAVCIDTWLQSQQTCPLCRSAIAASDADLMALVSNSGAAVTNGNGGSFRLEIGSVSRRNGQNPIDQPDSTHRSYSIGSFDYVVEDDSSEVRLSNALKDDVVMVIAEPEQPIPHSSLAAEAGSGGASWLKDYIDRLSSSLSSRDISFRSSGRFFTGSSRRSEVSAASDWGEAGRVGEEISEMFRWLSGV